MVKRLHRQLKAAMMTTEDCAHWIRHLPLVLFGIRATFKADITCTSAELAYDMTLQLPGEFLISVPSPSTDTPTYLQDLRNSFASLRLTPDEKTDCTADLHQRRSSNVYSHICEERQCMISSHATL